MHNHAEVVHYGAHRLLAAEQGPFALALAANTGGHRQLITPAR